MLREAKHSRSRRTPRLPPSALALQGVLTALRASHSKNALRHLCRFRLHRGPSTHGHRAKREAHFAQDDSCRVHLISTVKLLVVSFPRMSITSTTTVYSHGSTNSCFAENTSLEFKSVR